MCIRSSSRLCSFKDAVNECSAALEGQPNFFKVGQATGIQLSVPGATWGQQDGPAPGAAPGSVACWPPIDQAPPAAHLWMDSAQPRALVRGQQRLASCPWALQRLHTHAHTLSPPGDPLPRCRRR